MNMLTEWAKFSDAVMRHISESYEGHYAVPDGPQLLDVLAARFGAAGLAWQVIKYAFRFPETKRKGDLMKAAHYLMLMARYTGEGSKQ